MAERTGHLVQEKHQCPWCGERRMHKRILYDGCKRNRCLSCNGTFPAMFESTNIVFDVAAVNLINELMNEERPAGYGRTHTWIDMLAKQMAERGEDIDLGTVDLEHVAVEQSDPLRRRTQGGDVARAPPLEGLLVQVDAPGVVILAPADPVAGQRRGPAEILAEQLEMASPPSPVSATRRTM